MNNRKITEWRREMRRAGIDDPATLDELEGHLREEMERLVEGGTREEEALRAAVEKLGKPEAIREEFAKGLNPKTERLKRRLRSIAVVMSYAVILCWAISMISRWSYDAFPVPGLWYAKMMGSHWFVSKSSVGAKHSFYHVYFAGHGKAYVGLMLRRPFHQRWETMWTMLGLIPMLPWWRARTALRWMSWCLFFVMGICVTGLVADSVIRPWWVSLTAFLLFPAYVAQGWWLFLRMRRGAKPRSVTAEAA